MSLKFEINSLCTQCYNCVQLCPVGAIIDLKEGFYIDDWACVSCHICYQVCPDDAVRIIDLLKEDE